MGAAARGHDVVVYEQFELGERRGLVHGRTRIFRLAYPETKWVRLAQDALAGWRELEAESGEELLHLNGLLELFREGVVSSEQALARVQRGVRAARRARRPSGGSG